MTILRERVQRELCLRADNRSDLSGAHERLHAADTNTAGSSHRGKQFCAANSVHHYRITRALVLWNFSPGSAVGRGLSVISTGLARLRQNNDNDREAVGRTVSTEVLQVVFYPLTLPLTVGPGSVLIRDYPRRKRTNHLGANLLTITAAAIGSPFVASDHFLLLELRGPAGRHYRPGRHERHCKTLLLPVGVHRVQVLWNGTSQLLSSKPRVAGVAAPLGAVRK
jgi:hypothetical protein